MKPSERIEEIIQKIGIFEGIDPNHPHTNIGHMGIKAILQYLDEQYEEKGADLSKHKRSTPINEKQ